MLLKAVLLTAEPFLSFVGILDSSWDTFFFLHMIGEIYIHSMDF